MNSKLYTDLGVETISTATYKYQAHIIVCNACGASTLSGDSSVIKHHPTCGGVDELEKWEEYYSAEEISR